MKRALTSERTFLRRPSGTLHKLGEDTLLRFRRFAIFCR